jgi:hypothetical protein
MAARGVVCSILIFVTSFFQLNATERTITDIKGRSIDVVLLGKTDSCVSAMRSDGVEFDISYDLLSLADRQFLLNWDPPKPEVTENAMDAVAIITTNVGSGTGFLAHDLGNTYLYTNQHVISDIMTVKVTDSMGDPIQLGSLEISNSQDVARFRVSKRPALLITDNVQGNERVVVLGNSEGAGVITVGKGTVKGVGPSEIEVDADFVPGNSGGPVVNVEKEVVGIATYVTKGDQVPDWVSKDTRYSKPRRFTIRPSRIDDWRLVSREEYAKQVGYLNRALELFNQAYWTFQMLDEGKGYISNMPEDWNRDILMILRNHNSRQKRPDGTRTNYYEGTNYVGSTTTSYIKKKEASRRANLRSLMKVLDHEFGDLSHLKKRQLDIDYLINNQIESAQVLEGWLNQLRADINNEVSISQSSY